MTLLNQNNIKKTMNFLISSGCTLQGAAGMTGNIYGESKCNPTCIEAQLIKRYKQEGFLKWNYGLYDQGTYDQYWEYYRSGAISEAEFLSPRQYTYAPHQYGAGICQWTTKKRKERWLSLAKDDHKALTDLDLQLNLLYWELKNAYQDVYRVLHSTINVEIASNYVLRHFECPANPSTLQTDRIAYASEILNLMKGATMYSPDKVIQIAENEVGYLEKASNSQLDSKTANAGKNNYTKYWRDLKPSWQGQAWCDLFVDWDFYKAYGKEAAQKLECGGFGEYYTPTSAQKYKDAGRFDKNGRRGDQIFFKNSQRIYHTGLVRYIKNGRVYTVEGNTSSGSGVIPNGGAVCLKSYSVNDSRIAGYGHPRYDASSESAKSTEGGIYMFYLPTIKRGDKGFAVQHFQEIYIARNIKLGWKQPDIVLDGDFGPATEKAVRWYQRARGLKEDGIVGPEVWGDLIPLHQ